MLTAKINGAKEPFEDVPFPDELEEIEVCFGPPDAYESDEDEESEGYGDLDPFNQTIPSEQKKKATDLYGDILIPYAKSFRSLLDGLEAEKGEAYTSSAVYAMIHLLAGLFEKAVRCGIEEVPSVIDSLTEGQVPPYSLSMTDKLLVLVRHTLSRHRVLQNIASFAPPVRALDFGLSQVEPLTNNSLFHNQVAFDRTNLGALLTPPLQDTFSHLHHQFLISSAVGWCGVKALKMSLVAPTQQERDKASREGDRLAGIQRTSAAAWRPVFRALESYDCRLAQAVLDELLQYQLLNECGEEMKAILPPAI
ncbi:hypothetical protein JCM8547_004824 [Rhodosporidiobolus lusitaniae]